MYFLFNKSSLVWHSFILALLALSACGKSGTESLTSAPQSNSPPASIITPRPQVITGWLDEYSSFIQDVVAGNYPELLNLAASRMTKVCPAWTRLSGQERELFWSSLLWSISGPESDRTRTAIYRETTLPTDTVTGQQIRSEGLLQLSYVDVVSYAYTGHDISWTLDKAMALSDYAKGLNLGNPQRTILNAYANLNLGLWIIYRHLTRLNPSEALDTALGHYWSTMRSSGSGFASVVANLKSSLPICFR